MLYFHTKLKRFTTLIKGPSKRFVFQISLCEANFCRALLARPGVVMKGGGAYLNKHYFCSVFVGFYGVVFWVRDIIRRRTQRELPPGSGASRN